MHPVGRAGTSEAPAWEQCHDRRNVPAVRRLQSELYGRFGIESPVITESSMANARHHPDRPRLGVGSTAAEIVRTVIRLIITEARLLRSELSEKIGLIGLGVALAVGGGVLLIMAVVLLFVAMISVLVSAGLSLTVATLIVFGVVLVFGLVCLWFGLQQLQLSNLVPRKTIRQVQKDFETIAPEAN
jgi:uncharacterized membrane protein YqjE